MSQPTHRLEFAPPPTPGLLRSIGLAVLAHGVLIAVLTAGLAWKREAVVATVEAELWSAVPQEAAPPPAPEAPPEPPLPRTEPQPEPRPEPPPAPAPQAEPVPPPRSPADIALAHEKEKQARLQKEKEQLEKQKQDKLKLAKEKLEKEKLEKEKQAREKAQKEQREKQTKEAAAREAREAKRLEEERQKNIQRMQKMAGGSTAAGAGAATSTGSAAQASGPSAGYMGRIVARIKPNIVFTETVAGNPRAEVEIRVSPTGAILSARITQSSGIKAWDDAVLRAIEKTDMLPKDVDGAVPTSMQIGFRPKD